MLAVYLRLIFPKCEVSEVSGVPNVFPFVSQVLLLSASSWPHEAVLVCCSRSIEKNMPDKVDHKTPMPEFSSRQFQPNIPSPFALNQAHISFHVLNPQSPPTPLPSSQISIKLFLLSPLLIFCTTRSGFSGFLHSHALNPGVGTRFAKSYCIALFVSTMNRPWYSARSTWSRKLVRAGFVCNWKMREIWAWEFGEGSAWR